MFVNGLRAFLLITSKATSTAWNAFVILHNRLSPCWKQDHLSFLVKGWWFSEGFDRAEKTVFTQRVLFLNNNLIKTNQWFPFLIILINDGMLVLKANTFNSLQCLRARGKLLYESIRLMIQQFVATWLITGAHKLIKHTHTHTHTHTDSFVNNQQQRGVTNNTYKPEVYAHRLIIMHSGEMFHLSHSHVKINILKQVRI